MNKFKIVIASVPDRNNLVAEIWFEDSLICEITNENNLEVEFYNLKKSKFNYDFFLQALINAKEKLLVS